MATAEEEKPHKQAVRFSSQDEEIDPVSSLELVKTITSPSEAPEQLSPEAQQELKNLTMSLQTSRLQTKRLMENFSFEPVSLPPSRAPSPSSSMRTSSLVGQSGSAPSPLPSPRPPPLHSPPLTPAGTASREDKGKQAGETSKGQSDPALMTPQVSPPHEPPPTSIDDASHKPAAPPSQVPHHHPIPPPIQTSRPKLSDMAGVVQPHPRSTPQFSLGPTGDSVPGSGEASPAASPAVTPGGSTPAFSRPFTPSGEKRTPQPQNLGGLDARAFIFGDRRGQAYSPSASTENLPRPRGSTGDPKANEEKRSSGFFGSSRKADKSDAASEKAHREELGSKHHAHGSMSELKRFFKIGGHKHHKDKEQKRPQSPAPSMKSAKSSKSGTKTPPSTPGSISVPFADDHGLQNKYGKFGKVLGSGAGGSVRLMKRSSDGVTFAVKQFRPRHSYETEKEYSKKVTAEFCIGSTLHHGNIIETMDLVHEKGNWYVVMEYAPFDLFAIVMTGKMSREEVTCCTLQILSGVSFLHSMGLAHRDLKLDNVVVNEHGIMKIIDFGSAAVFRYPFEHDIVLATGIVGSDPYLAPEVYDLAKYDPQPTDVWSMAIIFCCMTLRRFPWKAPRVSDNSYKLFVAPPNDGPRLSVGDGSRSSASLGDLPDRERRREGSYAQSEPTSRATSGTSDTSSGHHHHHHRQRDNGASAPASSAVTANGNSTNSSSTTTNTSASTAATSVSSQSGQPQVIKGPWRLLRLLPRESRYIIGRMLEVDPRKRATLDEVLADRWVQNAAVCSQEEGGAVIRAEGHDHTLEPGAGDAAGRSSSAKK